MWIYDKHKHLGVSLVSFPQLGMGYDVAIFSPEATVADYVQALDAWQEQYLADCKGCDSCCHERAPLGLPDYYQSRSQNTTATDQAKNSAANGQEAADRANHCLDLAPNPIDAAATATLKENAAAPNPIDPADLARWLAATAQWEVLEDGALDITLARQTDGACRFLDPAAKICTNHSRRPLVCHTHVCLPKSRRAQELRQAIINRGEDALAAALLRQPNLAPICKIDNYPRLPALENEWENVYLRTILSPELLLALQP